MTGQLLVCIRSRSHLHDLIKHRSSSVNSDRNIYDCVVTCAIECVASAADCPKKSVNISHRIRRAIAALENTPLVLHAAPLTCAVTEDGAVLADPSLDEASGCARATVVVGVDLSSGDAPSLLKVSVNGAMPAAALEKCIALAAKRAATIQWPHAMAD